MYLNVRPEEVPNAILPINFNMRCTQLMKNKELRMKNEGGNFL